MNRVIEYIDDEALLKTNPEVMKECGLQGIDLSEKSNGEWLAIAEEEIRKFPFNTVSTCWFAFYTTLRIIEANRELSLHTQCNGHLTEICEHSLSKAIKSLDYAYIIADNIGHQNEIQHVLELLKTAIEQQSNRNQSIPGPPRPSKRRRLNDAQPARSNLPAECIRLPKITSPARQVQAPSLDQFSQLAREIREPVVLNDTLDHWPALEKWQSSEFWLKQTLGGRRHIPVEIGQSYTDDDWRQEIMPFREFLDTYIMNVDNANDVGYLAQHDLMKQIPDLRKDIAVPDYCYCERSSRPVREQTLWTTCNSDEYSTEDVRSQYVHSDSPDNTSTHSLSEEDGRSPREIPETLSPPASEEPNVQEKIWMGGRTVSPLHHDPYDNILCQVHGTKYVRLYSPKHSSQLYPRSKTELAPHVDPDNENDSRHDHTIDMSNNSQVDVHAMELSPMEDWDEKWPEISQVPYLECLLKPGQALYIPKGWWHYVRACSVCVSVSFWW